jgi:hypothetical protein
MTLKIDELSGKLDWSEGGLGLSGLLASAYIKRSVLAFEFISGIRRK